VWCRLSDRFREKDPHFCAFAKQLENAIARYGNLTHAEVTAKQKQGLQNLVELETEFRQTLIKHPWGAGVYRQFVAFITEEKRNILAARPYFRERQDVFKERISYELKRGNEKGLYPFAFNYMFVRFALRAKPWSKNSKIARIERQIVAARNELVEMNMPLAINRSRIFWKKTPESHLSYMDLVQIAAEGLMVAIDKYCPAARSAFAGVAIGRMVGFFIEQYSETMIHFFPTDKRKIYRANKLASRFMQDANNVDWEKLAESVNVGVDDGHKTNANEIASLMLAASTVSADAQVSNNASDGDGENYMLDRFAAQTELQPDKLVEESEAFETMRTAIDDLSIFEAKYLRLKGIGADSL
jgi:DNA-directed RNA polymerase specialized sigma subunit